MHIKIRTCTFFLVGNDILHGLYVVRREITSNKLVDKSYYFFWFGIVCVQYDYFRKGVNNIIRTCCDNATYVYTQCVVAYMFKS
jgi:hypothetical protein